MLARISKAVHLELLTLVCISVIQGVELLQGEETTHESQAYACQVLLRKRPFSKGTLIVSVLSEENLLLPATIVPS